MTLSELGQTNLLLNHEKIIKIMGAQRFFTTRKTTVREQQIVLVPLSLVEEINIGEIHQLTRMNIFYS